MASARALRESLGVLALAVLLTVFHTYPVAFQLGRVGRVDSGDGRWSVWVVNWVAHALLTDPANLFNANIFHPHSGTLGYSEPNLGGGVLAVPVLWATGNPMAAHNSVALASFALALLAAYALVRHLTGSRTASLFTAIAFAFCPCAFSRTAWIHLMLGAGIPLSLLAMHRFVAQASIARAVTIGAVLAAQGVTCGYYGVFAGLAVAFGLLFFAATRGLWRSPRYWMGVALALFTTVALLAPLLVRYAALQGEGFGRSLQESTLYSANWPAYLASSAWAHRWMLPLIGRWTDVLFPGFLTIAMGLLGVIVGLRVREGRVRDHTAFYAVLGGLAFWASFGPAAGLYSLLYRAVPAFSFLRAPSRLGIMVVLCLAVLAGLGLAELQKRRARVWRPVAIALSILLAAELTTMPLRWPRAYTVPDVHLMLATLPHGAVVEFPFYREPPDYYRHSLYMLLSTYHWQPLLNGYSDHIPDDFRVIAGPVSRFPSREAFRLLQQRGIRYALFHLNLYGSGRGNLIAALREQDRYLRPLRLEESMLLYEIVAWPAASGGAATR